MKKIFKFPENIDNDEHWRYGIDIDLFELDENLAELGYFQKSFCRFSMNETFNKKSRHGYVIIKELYYDDNLIAEQIRDGEGNIISTSVNRIVLERICYFQQYIKHQANIDELK